MKRIMSALLALIVYRYFYLSFESPRRRKYFSYVLRHKWYVMIESIKLGVAPHQAIAHDWSKFLPSELIPYSVCFRTPDGIGRYLESPEFAAAWNHHQKRNPHHWQYWMLTWDRGETECLPMPDKYRREMLADWRGAGRALGFPDTKAWYVKNRDNIKLHPDTRAWIDHELGIAE